MKAIHAGVAGALLAIWPVLVSAQTLATDKSAYARGEDVVITFAGMKGTSSDWISVVPVGTPADQWPHWSYTGGSKDGRVTFRGLPAGRYEARAYFDWANEAPTCTIRARCTFIAGPVETHLARYLELQAELAQLEAARTFEEEFLELKRVLGEVSEVLKATGEESVETAEKIRELLEKVQEKHASVRGLMERVGSGLERAGKSMGAVAAVVSKAEKAMAVLEAGVRARNGTTKDLLQAFRDYFGTLVDAVEPLVQEIPGLGAFVYVWSECISRIADDAARIEAEANRRNRLSRELTGRELYVQPGTEREILGRRVAAKRAEVEAAERQLLETFGDDLERSDGVLRPKSALDKAIERERAAAARKAGDLPVRAERASARRGRAARALADARAALRSAEVRFPAEDERALASKRARLGELGEETPYCDPGNATDEEKRRARDAWFARRDERSRLRRDIAPLAARETALQESRAAHAAALREWFDSDGEYRRLDAESVRVQREHLLERARDENWDTAWLRLRYPDLFRP